MGIEEEVLFGMRDNWPTLDQVPTCLMDLVWAPLFVPFLSVLHRWRFHKTAAEGTKCDISNVEQTSSKCSWHHHKHLSTECSVCIEVLPISHMRPTGV